MSLIIGYSGIDGIVAGCDSFRKYDTYNTTSTCPKFFMVNAYNRLGKRIMKDTEIYSGSVGNSVQGQDDRFMLNPKLSKLPFHVGLGTQEVNEKNSAFLLLSRHEQKTLLLEYMVKWYVPQLRKRSLIWNVRPKSDNDSLVFIAGHIFKLSDDFFVDPIPDGQCIAIGRSFAKAEDFFKASTKKTIKEKMLEACIKTAENCEFTGAPLHIVSKKFLEAPNHEVYSVNGNKLDNKEASIFLV